MKDGKIRPEMVEKQSFCISRYCYFICHLILFSKVRPSASATIRNITTTTSTTITTPPTTTNKTTCASEYPFAYLNGNYCCKTNLELPYGGSIAEHISGTCDGKGFSRESTCCKDHDYEECPHLEGCYDFSEGNYVNRFRFSLEF